MKALIKKSTGVEVAGTSIPELRNPDDVLIRIALAGLCRTDIYVAEGRIPTRNPLILGHEFSGIVEQVGKDATHIQENARVAVMPLFAPANDFKLKNGLTNYAGGTMMGIDHDGAFSEYVVVPASAVFKLPDQVSLMQGAYMEPVAASLAVINASIQPHEKGLIFGDNRISRLTERIMRAKGFNNLEVCESSEILPPNAYDFIIETFASTETMTKITDAVKPGGRIILKSRQHTPVAFNINKLVMKDIILESVSYGSFQEGIDLIASGFLKVDDLFGDVFPLEKFETVFAESSRAESKKLFFSAADRHVWDS